MQNISADMTSWFPLFIPLRTPLYVLDNGEVDVGMWRRTDGRRVWYEWVVDAFSVGNDRRAEVEVGPVRAEVRGGQLLGEQERRGWAMRHASARGEMVQEKIG
ncbi:hypothetical protein MRB53_037197 [Persea americana]|nr:hypothetical protein MRB53_037197 [Persea americana]